MNGDRSRRPPPPPPTTSASVTAVTDLPNSSNPDEHVWNLKGVDMENFLINFYSKYNKLNVANVEDILNHYLGNEQKLLRELTKKYTLAWIDMKHYLDDSHFDRGLKGHAPGGDKLADSKKLLDGINIDDNDDDDDVNNGNDDLDNCSTPSGSIAGSPPESILNYDYDDYNYDDDDYDDKGGGGRGSSRQNPTNSRPGLDNPAPPDYATSDDDEDGDGKNSAHNHIGGLKVQEFDEWNHQFNPWQTNLHIHTRHTFCSEARKPKPKTKAPLSSLGSKDAVPSQPQRPKSVLRNSIVSKMMDKTKAGAVNENPSPPRSSGADSSAIIDPEGGAGSANPNSSSAYRNQMSGRRSRPPPPPPPPGKLPSSLGKLPGLQDAYDSNKGTTSSTGDSNNNNCSNSDSNSKDGVIGNKSNPSYKLTKYRNQVRILCLQFIRWVSQRRELFRKKRSTSITFTQQAPIQGQNQSQNQGQKKLVEDSSLSLVDRVRKFIALHRHGAKKLIISQLKCNRSIEIWRREKEFYKSSDYNKHIKKYFGFNEFENNQAKIAKEEKEALAREKEVREAATSETANKKRDASEKTSTSRSISASRSKSPDDKKMNKIAQRRTSKGDSNSNPKREEEGGAKSVGVPAAGDQKNSIIMLDPSDPNYINHVLETASSVAASKPIQPTITTGSKGAAAEPIKPMSYREVVAAIDKFKRNEARFDEAGNIILDYVDDKDGKYDNKENSALNSRSSSFSTNANSNPYFRKKVENQITQAQFKVAVCKQENKNLFERYKKSEVDNFAIIDLFEKIVTASSPDMEQAELQVKLIEEFLGKRGALKKAQSEDEKSQKTVLDLQSLAGLFFAANQESNIDGTSINNNDNERDASSGRSRRQTLVNPVRNLVGESSVSAVLESKSKLPGYMNYTTSQVMRLVPNSDAVTVGNGGDGSQLMVSSGGLLMTSPSKAARGPAYQQGATSNLGNSTKFDESSFRVRNSSSNVSVNEAHKSPRYINVNNAYICDNSPKSTYRDSYQIQKLSPVKPNVFGGIKLADKKSYERFQEIVNATRFVEDPMVIHEHLVREVSPRKSPAKKKLQVKEVDERAENFTTTPRAATESANTMNSKSRIMKNKDEGGLDGKKSDRRAETVASVSDAGDGARDDWIEKIDKKTSRYYYYSPSRRISQWKRP